MKMDRWKVAHHADGIVLGFGNAKLATSIYLDRGRARLLLDALTQQIAQCEARLGTIWSEDYRHQRAANVDTLGFTAAADWPPERQRLHDLVANLPLGAYEQSFKMLNGRLYAERFLVGLPRAAITPGDCEALAGSMGAPPAFRAQIRELFSQATFLHIGFEEAAVHCWYKLYLEFAGPEALASMPLYIGYKWDPARPLRHVVSRYTRQAPLPLPRMLDTIAMMQPDWPLCASAQAIIELAAALAPAEPVPWVLVDDDAGARASFDIHLYACGLRLAALAPLLDSLALRLAIPRAELAALVARCGDHVLGHVSSGTDRSGNGFLTLYHARELAPASAVKV